jgi:hypothetical protein
MPQFLFVELPSFRIKDTSGHSVSLNRSHRGQIIASLQYIRSGLQLSPDFSTSCCASILFHGAETDIWTSSHTPGSGGLHAEENLLLTWHQSFESPGAYPIIDAMLLSHKPCSNCLPYFTGGKHCKPSNGVPGFRAKFTPRSDRQYTPVFHLAASLDAAGRQNLWFELATMWTSGFLDVVVSSPDVERGKCYYVMEGSAWYAVNGQEGMTDAEIADAISTQGALATYWIGR